MTGPVSEETVAALQSMRWPGNIRQLRNVIERVLILAESHGPILPSELEPQGATPDNSDTLSLGPSVTAMALREARELFEREYLLAQINRFGGNISRTAQFVGMERSALHRKLKSLGVVGGVLGSMVGGGTGRTLATVGGAVLGAGAGYAGGKALGTQDGYEITVDLDNGGSTVITQGISST